MARQFDFDDGEAGNQNNGAGNESGEQPGNNASNLNGGSTANSSNDASSIPPIAKSRRGRPSLPRDASGNIIRDGSVSSNQRPDKEKSKGLDLKGQKFVANDRPKVRQQIQGIHQAVAMLTKQPVFILTDDEANGFTSSLCDVLDYHSINLTQAGGAAGLYLTLAITAFGIYKPRLDYIAKGGQVQVERPTAPSSPDEIIATKGTMDFTGDIQPGIQETMQ